MSVLQTIRQLEYLADTMTWATSGKRIFAKDSVVYSALPWRAVMQHLNFPWCVVNLISMTNHAEIQGLMDITFRMAIGVKHENDRMGKMILAGGRQTSTTQDSDDKGVLQLKTQLSTALKLLTRENAIIFGVRELSSAVGGAEVEGQQFAVLEVDYQAIAFEESYYTDVYNLASSQSGADVVLTWSADPPARYDRIATDGITICRKTGSNPTGPTDGAIGTVDIGVKTYTDTAPAANTYYYGVFVGYDETNETPATAESYSTGKFVTQVVS